MYCGEPGHGPVELFADWVSARRRGLRETAGATLFLPNLGEQRFGWQRKFGTLATAMKSSCPPTIAVRR